MHACFRPNATPRPCRHCRYLLRLEPPSGSALCGQGGKVSRTGQPDCGCALWEREPGSDDDVDLNPDGAPPCARDTSGQQGVP